MTPNTPQSPPRPPKGWKCEKRWATRYVYSDGRSSVGCRLHPTRKAAEAFGYPSPAFTIAPVYILYRPAGLASKKARRK